jgi:hypothetical protein
VPDTAAVVESVTTDAGPPRKQRRTVGVWALVVTVVLACAVVAMLLRSTAAQSAQATAALLQDVTATSTYQELMRQVLLPADQRSQAVLEAVVASPQSDRTGAIWTTEVLSTRFDDTALTAQVATSYSTAPMSGFVSYLEFVAHVLPPRDAGSSPEVLACVVRTGTPSAPVATSYATIGDRINLPPCPGDVLQRLGIG